MMAYILESPDLLSNLQREIGPVFENSDSPCSTGETFDSCPRFLAVYFESMRLTASSVSIRNVIRPLEVGGKVLRPGNRVLIPYKQILMDTAAFGSDSDTFNATRFFNDPTLSKSPRFNPFGSGTTHCPGRFLAQKEVLTFVALVLNRYEIKKSKISQFGSDFPRLDLAKPCIRIMSPVKGDDILLNVRPL
jgi:cytochrome P450